MYILQSPHLTPETAQTIAREALGGELEARPGGWYRVRGGREVAAVDLAVLRARYRCDINWRPPAWTPRLLVSDMDSTLINIECIDEIADFAGVKPHVAAITERAMRGEIVFEEALQARVRLLKDLPVAVLTKVYEERLRPNPGAEIMLAALRAAGIKIALVSGGFTFFTQRLQADLALDFARANTLEVQEGRLTGRVLGGIVGAQAKREFLLELCTQLRIPPTETVAMGDGANDLAMMQVAGYSIAYHAKPRVQAQAQAVIEYCGLEAVAGLIEPIR